MTQSWKKLLAKWRIAFSNFKGTHELASSGGVAAKTL